MADANTTISSTAGGADSSAATPVILAQATMSFGFATLFKLIDRVYFSYPVK